MSTAVVEASQTPDTQAAAQPASREVSYPQPGTIARFFRNTWAIAKKELNIYFATPLAYVFFSVFVFILSYFFVVFVQQYLEYSMRAQQFAQFQPGALEHLNFTDLIFAPLLSNAAVVFVFIIPFLSMRLLAEERKQQTFALLMTSPVGSWEIVLGKFLSATFVVGFLIALTFTYPLLLNAVADGGGVELQTAATGYLGLFLLAASFMSIGLFVSSLTDSQIAAGFTTMGVLLLLWVLSWASGSAEGLSRELLEYVSFIPHMRNFLRGTINLADVTYFLSVIVLGLFLTRTSIERSRW